jgi:predicted GNAT family N-acyltransferase
MENRRKNSAQTNINPPAVIVRAGERASDRMKAMFIRHSVFIEELTLPVEWEQDGRDEDAVLLIAMDSATGSPVGTARVVDDGEGVANIGRLAVSASYRGCGVGTALLQAALKSSGDLGFVSAVIDTPVSAVPFCRKSGFVEHGDEFAIGAVPHRRVGRPLAASDT